MRRLFTPVRELVVAWFLGALALLAILIVRDGGWVLIWSRASAVIDCGAIFAAPVLAAAACAITQRRSAARPRELVESTSRPGAARRGLDLLRLLIVAVVATVTGHGAAWAVAAWRGASGRPLWGYVLLTATTLAVASVLGYLIGRVTRARVASVGVAVGVYAAMMLWPQTDGVPFWYVIDGWPQLAVAPRVLIGRAVLLVVSAAAACLATRTRPMRTWSASMAVISVMVLVIALGSPVTLRAPGERVCTTTDVAVCLWPDNGGYLPQVAAAADAVREAIAGSAPNPAGPLLDEGLGGVETVDGVRVLGSEVTVRFGPGEIPGSILAAWFDAVPVCSDERAATDEAGLAFVLWYVWASTRVTSITGLSLSGPELSPTQQSTLAEVDVLSEDEQVQWAAEQVAVGTGCA